ncbi:hypothetical protein JQC81_15355 [Microvirga arabica]|nr:hypothetical protein [Microvirga arabica]
MYDDCMGGPVPERLLALLERMPTSSRSIGEDKSR